MTPDTAVSVRNLGKRFKLYLSPRQRATEWLTAGIVRTHREFWALRNVSCELKRGEGLVVIGRNGAGKSTLLRILTGSLNPTTGEHEVRGRAHSLLELNSGFDRELTGRENLFRGAQLLNLPEWYLPERLAEIEAFAELGEFFDQPLKIYSKGMQARLGFSLLALLESDVLILDEILGVGDMFFREKCLQHMRALMSKGTTVILTSHGLREIPEFFREALVLNQGQSIFKGPIVDAQSAYQTLLPVRR